MKTLNLMTINNTNTKVIQLNYTYNKPDWSLKVADQIFNNKIHVLFGGQVSLLSLHNQATNE